MTLSPCNAIRVRLAALALIGAMAAGRVASAQKPGNPADKQADFYRIAEVQTIQVLIPRDNPGTDA